MLVADAVTRLVDAGARVLSPVDPTPSELIGEFWYIASDLHRDRILVERRHLAACAASDLIWLIAPDGYIGVSAAAEVAYAAGCGVPIYTADYIHEPALAALVHTVAGVRDAVGRVSSTHSLTAAEPAPSMLIDPDAAADRAIDAVNSLRQVLCGRAATEEQADVLTAIVYGAVPSPSRHG